MMPTANILAITFTNKAVHEMKSRIVGSLSEFAKTNLPKANDLMQDLSIDNFPLSKSKQNHSKSSSTLFIIMRFDISTIDKFT
jgi:ATP-dependent exoDNAse (exonuclease V) beta subunit